MDSPKHFCLFNAGPQRESLKIVSKEVQHTLEQLHRKIQARIGEGQSIELYPHRVVKHYWALEIQGSKDTLHLLLNIAGSFRLPALIDELWPARLVIDVADHVDAYWLSMYLAQQLELKLFSPFTLSTVNGDNFVHNQAGETDETGENRQG